MKILFGPLKVFTSNRYAKFQSSNPILEGIAFSRYTMKTLNYCRTKVFALHKVLTRKVFLSLRIEKKSNVARTGEYGGKHTNLFLL